MGAPQIIIIALMALELLLTAFVHGEPRKGKFSFPVTLMKKAIVAWILWLGGFWG